MANPIQPWIVKWTYRTTLASVQLGHQLNMPVNMTDPGEPGDGFESFTVSAWGGAAILLSDYMATMTPLILAVFGDEVEFPVADLWFHDDGDPNGAYYSSYPVADVGTNAAVAISANEVIQTFRCLGGSILKLSLQETSYNSQAKLAYPSGLTALDALSTHILGTGSAWVGRDGTRPLAGLYANCGQNEKTWRRRNRPT
jgi:hypothetical protein